MYGFDVMLEWKKTMKKGWTIDDGKDEEEGKKTADDVQPVFIEANFTPYKF
jgi:hypothetical protein